MKRNGLIFVLSAPSATGKTTVGSLILNGNYGVQRSISSTTRNKRDNEIHGRDYYFLTISEFEQLKKEGKFLEHASVFGNYYGTSKNQIDEILNKGDDALLIIDVQGAHQLAEKKLSNAVFIFMLPPSMTELKERITKRGHNSTEEINRRMDTAREEIELYKRYDYVILNHDLNQARDDILSIIRAERVKLTNRKEHVLEFIEDNLMHHDEPIK